MQYRAELIKESDSFFNRQRPDGKFISNIYSINEPLISVIIPLFNEERSILNIIERTLQYRNCEIIVVDDGSTDKSLELVSSIKNPRVVTIKHEINKGYGAAILSGLKTVKGSYIITIDADGQHQPEDIPNLLTPLLTMQSDIVIGSRYMGKCNYKIPLHTRIGEMVLCFIFIFFFNQRILNNQNGFRAFKKEHIKIFKDIKTRKMGFSTEFLFSACRHQLRVKEVPINLKNRNFGASKVNIIRIFLSITLSVLKNTILKLCK